MYEDKQLREMREFSSSLQPTSQQESIIIIPCKNASLTIVANHDLLDCSSPDGYKEDNLHQKIEVNGH